MIVFTEPLAKELMKLDAIGFGYSFLVQLVSIIWRVVLILNFCLSIDAPDELFMHAEYLSS